MNFVWILFFFLAPTSAYSNLTFTCTFERGTLNIRLSFRNKTVSDIFSTDPENTCSLSNNDFIGNGTEDFPYEITVDIRRDQKSYKPCGAKVFNGMFNIGFAVKSFENFFAKDDYFHNFTCDPNNLHSSIGFFRVSSIRGKPNIGPMKMTLVSTNSKEIPEGQLVLGQKVKLKIEIPKDSDAKRGRVTLCYVRDTLHDNSTHTFYNDKCPVQSYPVPIKFVTNETNPRVIESTEFEAFRFHENGTVQFNCFVEVCIDETDPYCLNTYDCVPLGTFLHAYKEVKRLVRPVIEINSGATNQMSFMLMSVIAIIIFLTKIN